MNRQAQKFLETNRLWLYGMLIPIIITVIFTVTTGALGVLPALVWILVFALIVAILEGFLRKGVPSDSSVIWGKTARSLRERMPLSEAGLIAASGVKGVTILGGTLAEFSANRGNIEALRDLIRDGHPVRILMLDAKGEGVEHIAEQRRQVIGSVNPVDESRNEIRSSLRRLEERLGKADFRRCCRLLFHAPRNSVYQLGDRYIVTVYSFGRGGGSPAFFLERNEENQEFCDGLDRNFEVLWSAESTRAITDDDLL